MFEMILKVITSDIFVLFIFQKFLNTGTFLCFFYKNDVELRYWKNEYVHMKE